MTRFAWYGRLSTTDKQDASLARPSQLAACERLVLELGGSVTATFWDEESGGHASRPALNDMLAEARNKEHRRFDQIVCFQTSRLARVQLDALLHERELNRAKCPIVYVHGGGSELEKGLSQLIDQHMRARLKEETRRGMKANALAGYRNGGIAPYGYLLSKEPHSNPARAKHGETKSRLVVNAEQAPVVVEIFTLWAVKGLGSAAIADRLNARGEPSPTATNPRLNVRGDWAKSTINSILKNPSYTGRVVWDRLDVATRREVGGSAPRRPEDEWTVCEGAHEAIVSDDMFALAQERLRSKSKRSGHPRKGRPVHMLSGMVRCATGHAPLSTYGSVVKSHTYYRCTYGVEYGREAAAAISGHGVTCNVNEAVLLPFIERFFADRVFGPMRLDLLDRQLKRQAKVGQLDLTRETKRLTAAIAEANHAIAAQVRGLEAGVDAQLVQARIDELKASKATSEASLATLQPPADDHTDMGATLAKLPDLSDALREAPDDTKRRLFDSFDVRLVYDKIEGRIEISATVTEAVAGLLVNSGLSLCEDKLRGWDSNPQLRS
jgi:site-specific DNA recombinase